MMLQFSDLEGVLKDLKPGAVIKYVARNGTIAEVVFVGHEDWRAALAQVGQSAIDARVAKDDARAMAKTALHSGVELRDRVDHWVLQTDQRIGAFEMRTELHVDNLQNRIFRHRFLQDGQNYFLSNRMKRWHRLDFWLAVAGLLAGLAGIVIGVT